MKNILITGANGFIGSNLCGFFADRGYQVFGLVRETSDLTLLEGIQLDLVVGDLSHIASVDLPGKLDFIVHAASVVSDTATEQQCREGILDATVGLVEYIRHLESSTPRFIYISTAITLGYCDGEISEEHPGQSVMYLPYTKYKKQTEDHLLSLHRETGFPCVILRPAHVFGPKDRTSCMRMLEAAEKGIPLIVGKGNATFPYCYIENLCQAAYLSCSKDGAIVEGQGYSVTNKSLPTWKEFFSHLQTGVSRKQRIYVPVLPILIAGFINGLIMKVFSSFDPSVTYYRVKQITCTTTYDISKTVRELGYAPEDDYSSQFDMIVSWYLDYKRDTMARTR